MIMKLFDLLLSLLLPALILLHLVVAPYTKVEESFNIQATHDILKYGFPTQEVSAGLRATYDHIEFPGAVPRTFVGALALSGLSKPIIAIVGQQYSQVVARAVLGLFNALALLKFNRSLVKAFGPTTGRWYLALQASQFHVIYYASRTLPNMYAFGLSTLALSQFLPVFSRSNVRRTRIFGIYYLVFAGVVFRSEIALFLFTHVVMLLIWHILDLEGIVRAGLLGAIVALGVSVPVDSYFWLRPIWPELSGFIFNALEGNSVEWGTSPWNAYFVSFLPKLLLNPLVPLVLLPLSCQLPATRIPMMRLLSPSLAFIALYSLQPHKEARFILYAVPPITATAATAAAYVTTHRSRYISYQILHWLLCLSVLGAFVASTTMLVISSLNYPGGEALFRLHKLANADGAIYSAPLKVHMDVFSCMTGVTRFQQDSPTPPVWEYISLLTSKSRNVEATSNKHSTPAVFIYDKTENETTLHDPTFWTQFDYILTSTPELIIGRWDTYDTIYAYAGIELLRPGQEPASHEVEVARIYEHALNEDKSQESGSSEKVAVKNRQAGKYAETRASVRKLTGGWWIGPKMEAMIWILRRISDSEELHI